MCMCENVCAWECVCLCIYVTMWMYDRCAQSKFAVTYIAITETTQQEFVIP